MNGFRQFFRRGPLTSVILAAGVVLLTITTVSLLHLLSSNSTHLLDVQPAYAQDGAGSDPTNKVNSIDFYPDPLAEGALAFSLRDPWDHTDLTYFFHNCPTRLDCVEARQAVQNGFLAWANISALTFAEAPSASDADIEVRWVDGNSDPEGELGSEGGTLAYAYFPRYGGDMFIDDVEPWTLGDGGEFDLVITATHEIGHAIGLGHSEFTSAIMYPYSGYSIELGSDDIAAVQELYGPPTGTTPPASDTDSDDNDTPVREIPAGEDTMVVDGTISDDEPFESWDLTVESGDTVTISMEATSSNLDPYIGILDEDLSTVLAENDDFGESRDSQLTYTFEAAGTYTIVATRFGFEDGTSSGNYRLTVAFASNGGPGDGPDTQEPDTGTVTWRVTNFADTDLCYIYFSASSSDDWGPDQLNSDQVLNNDFYLEWEVPRDIYDLQVWDCFGNKLERYSIPARRSIDIQVFSDSIEVAPLDPGQANQPAAPPTILTWRVTNYADTELCEVYFSPTTDDNWGPNRLLEENLANNFYLEWELAPGTYDLQVWDCFGNNLEERDINFQRDVEIQIYSDQILVVPLN